METITCIKERRSIRKFTEEMVTEETMREIIEAAAYAPSWKNTQIARYTLVQNPAVIDKIAEEATLGFTWNENTMKHAKSIVIVSYVKGRCGFEKDGSYTTSKGEQWQMFDAGIATQTFSLAAWEKGVGSVIMGIFDEHEVAKCIHLPETETVAAILAIGYPAEIPTAPKRKEAQELLRVVR